MTDSLDLLIVETNPDREEIEGVITEVAPDFKPRIFAELKQNKVDILVENEIFLKIRFISNLRNILEILDWLAREYDGVYNVENIIEIRGQQYKKLTYLTFDYYLQKIVKEQFVCEVHCFYTT